MPPVEHSVLWHDAFSNKKVSLSCSRHAAYSVAVMLHIWYAITFRFDSHPGDYALMFRCIHLCLGLG